jgi:hypothetical protein
LFTAPDVRTLLSAIRGANFTTADLKAVVSQETGDLTNIRVHGISSTKPGIRTSRRNRGGHVGFGQHTSAASREAIAWAAAQGVTIPARPDPRKTPATSIKLTAAFLGRVADLLQSTLPSVIPAGDEFKKLVFAAYNGGHRPVARAARAFVAGGSTAYTWDDIKTHSAISGQMRNYVREIVTRLS